MAFVIKQKHPWPISYPKAHIPYAILVIIETTSLFIQQAALAIWLTANITAVNY